MKKEQYNRRADVTKPRGTPSGTKQKYEHYIALAKSQAAMGDNISAENYFQHAEHYLRSMHA